MSYTPDEQDLLAAELQEFWVAYHQLLQKMGETAATRAAEHGDSVPPWHKIEMPGGVISIMRLKLERLHGESPAFQISNCIDICNYALYLAAYNQMILNQKEAKL
jgi:hypothetical protein